MNKGLEALKDLVDTMPFAFLETNSMKYVEIIEKELKALEIIKKKEVNVYDFKEYESKYEYNKHTKEDFQELTQEEYDLLKEVLL